MFEEGEVELHLAHRVTAKLTARTYSGSQQAGGPESRCGSDQRTVMPAIVRAAGRDSYSVVLAMPSRCGPGRGSEPEDPDVQREKVRCVIPLGATSDVTL